MIEDGTVDSDYERACFKPAARIDRAFGTPSSVFFQAAQRAAPFGAALDQFVYSVYLHSDGHLVLAKL